MLPYEKPAVVDEYKVMPGGGDFGPWIQSAHAEIMRMWRTDGGGTPAEREYRKKLKTLIEEHPSKGGRHFIIPLRTGEQGS